MLLNKQLIADSNTSNLKAHQRNYDFVAAGINNLDDVIQKLVDFQVAIPSWALGTGGTRFGRFSGGGEPGNLEEKIEDIGLLHALNQSSGAISLHIPWDIPSDATAIKTLAAMHGLKFDAVNSNTFQDQKDQAHSYKFGSLQHVDKAVRKQAIEHNIEVIKQGEALGSKSLTSMAGRWLLFSGTVEF
jgi:L-rhamnose isomerase/sugar isomerase